jgi:hypothetical protein
MDIVKHCPSAISPHYQQRDDFDDHHALMPEAVIHQPGLNDSDMALLLLSGANNLFPSSFHFHRTPDELVTPALICPRVALLKVTANTDERI